MFQLLTACLLLGLASGQGDGGRQTCSALNVNHPSSLGDSPPSGADLDLCQTEEEQCCTQGFLDGVRQGLGGDLLNGLREEVTNRVGDVQGIMDQFSTYFEGDFIEDIRRKLPVAQLLDNLENITSALTTFLARANLAISSSSPERNTTEIFVDIMMQIEDSINGSDTLSEGRRECIVAELRRHTSQSSLTTIGRTLRTLRQSFSGIARILEFLIRFNQTLDGFTVDSFPADCVTRMIDISICGRCRQRIPPLCRNSCGGLVRACFAAFYSGLHQEFNNLWGVVLQLVSVVDQGVRELFEAVDGLQNDIDIVEVHAFDCNLLGLPRRGTVQETLLPNAVMTSAERLSGVFTYGCTVVVIHNGVVGEAVIQNLNHAYMWVWPVAPPLFELDPALITSSGVERILTGTSGPEFCGSEREEEAFCNGARNREDRSCDSDQVCTSSCQCWDGTSVREADIMEFTGVGIKDQGDNPVLRVPEQENIGIASMRSSVVNSFLTSEEFTEVMPVGVVIPPPATFEGEADGGSILLASMVTVLGTVLFTRFVLNV